MQTNVGDTLKCPGLQARSTDALSHIEKFF